MMSIYWGIKNEKGWMIKNYLVTPLLFCTKEEAEQNISESDRIKGEHAVKIEIKILEG